MSFDHSKWTWTSGPLCRGPGVLTNCGQIFNFVGWNLKKVLQDSRTTGVHLFLSYVTFLCIVYLPKSKSGRKLKIWPQLVRTPGPLQRGPEVQVHFEWSKLIFISYLIDSYSFYFKICSYIEIWYAVGCSWLQLAIYHKPYLFHSTTVLTDWYTLA